MDPVALLLLPAAADILFCLFALVPGYGIGRALDRALALDAHPGRAVAAMAALGAALGAASLLAVPVALAPIPAARWSAFATAPLLAGGAMAALAHLRRKHASAPMAIETAASGFAFALAFMAVRMALAR